MALSSQHQGANGFDTLPPELQQEIFSYLDRDNASLFAAIQVSKAWNHSCISMLWWESTQKRLAKVRTPGRRQHYANIIRDWKLDDIGSSGALFDGLDFPLLECLSFLLGSLPLKQLCRCLQTGMHTLEFLQYPFDTTILDTVSLYGTQLHDLVIRYPDTYDITPDQFVTFLQSLPTLRRLKLIDIKENIMQAVIRWKDGSLAQLKELALLEDPENHRGLDPEPWRLNNFLQCCTGLRELFVCHGNVLSADTLAQLSCQESLEVLRIFGYISLEVGVQLRDRFSSMLYRVRLFPNIRRIDMAGGSLVINTLLSGALTTLTDLELVVDDNSDSVCPTIGRLSSLVRLHISFEKDRKLSQRDMDHISDLSKLEQCHIGSVEDFFGPLLEDPWLTDLYFKKWVKKLPQLRFLRLELNSFTITQAALQSLADSCPFMTSCQLIWEHDLSTWCEIVPPLFGNLESLYLGWVKNHIGVENQTVTDDSVMRNVEVIRSIAPKLKHLSIQSRRQHEMALVHAFRAGT